MTSSEGQFKIQMSEVTGQRLDATRKKCQMIKKRCIVSKEKRLHDTQAKKSLPKKRKTKRGDTTKKISVDLV